MRFESVEGERTATLRFGSVGGALWSMSRRTRTRWLLVATLLAARVGGAAPAAAQQGRGDVTPPNAAAAAPARAADAVTAFVDVAVIPMDQERVLPHQTVLVREGRIVALGPVAEVAIPDDATRIDGRDQFLLPGLADMHALLPSDLAWDLRPPQDSVVAGRRLARGRRILLRYLASGVTTVRLMQGLPSELLALRAEAARGVILSPRIYAAALPFALASRQGLTGAAAIERVEAAKQAGFDLLNLYDADGAFGIMRSLRWERQLIDTIFTAARRVGLPLAGPYVPKYVGSRRYPATSFERLAVSPEKPVQWPRAGADAKAGAKADAKPAAWLTPTLVYVTERAARMDPATAAQMVQVLRHKGAGVLLGTAGWGMNPAAVVPRELAALVAAGLTPYEALATGTRNAAAYFGTLDSVGTVAVGKRADLLLLAGNPLADIRHAAQPAGVMLGGRWLPAALLTELVALLEDTDQDIDDAS